MFEKLFKTASAIARHKEAHYAIERECYLKNYADQGYGFKYLRQMPGIR
jgi:hypothetical protein